MAGSPGSPKPTLILVPFLATGTKCIFDKAAAPAKAAGSGQRGGGSHEAGVTSTPGLSTKSHCWLQQGLPSPRALPAACGHAAATTPWRRCFQSPKAGVKCKWRIISTKSQKHKTCFPFLRESPAFWSISRHPGNNSSRSATQARPTAVWERHFFYK